MPAYPHFVLPANGQPEAYTAPGGGSGTFLAPPRDRPRHAQKLLNQIRAVRDSAEEQLGKSPATSDVHFIPVAFESAPDHALAIDSLENKPAGIRVVNVRTEDQKQIAVVAVPKDKIYHFEKRFVEFGAKDRVRTEPDGTEKRTAFHQKLVTSIEDLRLVVLRDYYTDSDGQPPPKDEVIWWEVSCAVLEQSDRGRLHVEGLDGRGRAGRLGAGRPQGTIESGEHDLHRVGSAGMAAQAGCRV
jgi:hypothetical protein